MLIRKFDKHYEFTAPTTDGTFIVTLILDINGQETLNTQPVGVSVKFPPRILENGTIRKAIGEEKWKNFERMKSMNVTTLFI